MKYSVTDRNKERTVRLESHFCGQGVKWGGDVVSNNRCFNEDNVEGEKLLALETLIKCGFDFQERITKFASAMMEVNVIRRQI